MAACFRPAKKMPSPTSLSKSRYFSPSVKKKVSAKFACPDCGYSLQELSPRLFSFNSPVGACQACDGLGVKEIFDSQLVVNDTLSLADGAIRGWDRRNLYYYQLLFPPSNYLLVYHHLKILFANLTLWPPLPILNIYSPTNF